MSIRRVAALIAFPLALFSTGCGSGTQGETIPRATPVMRTVTPFQNLTPLPSDTPPPSPAVTVAPVDGITSTQVNVRAEPSTASTVLGVIPADMLIEITGKDPGGNWWQINYAHPQAIDGKGWVTSQYITLPVMAEVPVIGGAETDLNNGSTAIVQQQLNVRSGPGTNFNSLGTLNPQDVVSLTGKDAKGVWLQIAFAEGPEGKGWVNAAFVQAQGVESVPIIAESGEIVGTGTPTVIPPTPSPTLVPAWDDSDSPDHPIAIVVLEPAGTRTFIYNGDVSAPVGDSEDWIGFRPYGSSVFVTLECLGSNTLEVKLLENNSQRNTYVKCDTQMEEVAVNAGSDYLLHLKALASAESLQYTKYILTIKTTP